MLIAEKTVGREVATFKEAIEVFLSEWSYRLIEEETRGSNRTACILARNGAEDWLGSDKIDDIKQSRLMLAAIHKAFGAPGDFGYDTKHGAALQLVYQRWEDWMHDIVQSRAPAPSDPAS